MTSKDPGGGGAKSVRKRDEPPINEEIRALYEKYGEDGDVPDHILALARQIEEAHAEVKPEGGGHADGDAGSKSSKARQ